MTADLMELKRGRIWFEALAERAARVDTGLPSVLVADAPLAGDTARLLSVVPYPHSRFPRARRGEIGLDEGWALARHVRDAIAEGTRRPIVAIVDARSQAYGRVEELLGIHLALAAAADAYVAARLAGHPVVALIVGQAVSGALLAHGYQAHRMLALNAPGVVIHAMHKDAAARITRRSVEELDQLGQTVIPMSYDTRQYARLGLLHQLIDGVDADAPSPAHVARVKEHVAAAVADIRSRPGDLTSRLDNPEAKVNRAASIEVRRRLAEQWNAP